MDRNSYKLNLKRSKDITEEYSNIILKKECYKNVFKTIFYFSEEERKRLKICYGYIDIKINNTETYLVRHSFFLLDNTVIDPTILLTNNKEKQDNDYYIFKKFTLPEYLNVIEKNDRYVSLSKYLLEYEIELFNYLLIEKDAQMNPIDVIELFKLYYGEDINKLDKAINQFNEKNQILPLY